MAEELLPLPLLTGSSSRGGARQSPRRAAPTTRGLRTRVQRITRRIAGHRRLEANRGAIPHAAPAFEGVHRATLDITPHLQHPRPVLHMERDGCARAEAPDAFDQCAAA